MRTLIEKLNRITLKQLLVILLVSYLLIVPVGYLVFLLMTLFPNEPLIIMQYQFPANARTIAMVVFGYSYSLWLIVISLRLLGLIQGALKLILLPYFCVLIFFSIVSPGILFVVGWGVSINIDCAVYNRCLPPAR